MELQAAVTAVRLKDTCIEELKMKVDNVYFDSDSKTVINYIRNYFSNFGVFVVHKIRNNREPKQWYHVPAKLNVAGDATRCLSVQNLQNNCRLFNGRKLLYEVNIEEYLTRNNINLDSKVHNAYINTVKKSSNRSKTKRIIY